MPLAPRVSRRATLVALALATLFASPWIAGGAVHAEPADDHDRPPLTTIARVNDMTVDKVRTLLRDRTLRVADDGHLYYVDPAPSSAPPAAGPAEAPAPLASTFLLHSNPDSTLKIFLDFDGAHVSGTWWNQDTGLPDGFYPGWDPAGDGATFSAAERVSVQEVWARVAEDFAPFGVDVTTQDPGDAGLQQAGARDPAYGVRVLVSPSQAARDSVCGGGCAGVAWLGVFGYNDVSGPAWVFPHSLADRPAWIAEAASHEAGHTVNLLHDATHGNPGYYGGHGVWSPIIGVSFGRAVSQWSKGDYPDANNQEDDLAIVAGFLGPRGDETGASVATAVPLGSGHGHVTTRADKDAYDLGTCSGALEIAASPAETGANLDLRLELLNASGATVASADPAGLSATVNTTVASGRYLVRVDGVGAVDYDDYASLGEYTIAVTGSCTPPPAAVPPSAPVNPTAVAHATDPTIVVGWQPPASTGGAPITGYRITRARAADVTVAASARSRAITGLEPGTTYTFAIAAVNAAGTGPAASVSATTAAIPPTGVRNLAMAWDRVARTVTLACDPPASDGGSPVTGYQALLDGTIVADGLPDCGTTVRDPRPGPHTFGIRAVNAVGPGPTASRAFTVPKYPSRTTLAAPKQARAGTRPRVTARVALVGRAVVARGRVRFSLNGRAVATLRLTAGRATVRLPRLRARPTRQIVKATYLGTGTVASSAASRTIRVVRR